MPEKWKAIKGYEGVYEVSSLGRIRTVERKVKTGENYRTVPGKIRKPNVMKGYHCIGLRYEGSVKVFRIHRLVAEAFIGAAPSEKHQVNHIDGDKSNNAVDNLEWVTPYENTKHAFENGLRPKTLPAETRRKIGEKSKKTWERDDYRKFQSEMAKEIWSDPKKHRERSDAIRDGIRRAKENGTYRKAQ